MAVFMRLWDAYGQGRLDDALDLIDPAASCAHRSPAACIAATTARARGDGRLPAALEERHLDGVAAIVATA